MAISPQHGWDFSTQPANREMPRAPWWSAAVRWYAHFKVLAYCLLPMSLYALYFSYREYALKVHPWPFHQVLINFLKERAPELIAIYLGISGIFYAWHHAREMREHSMALKEQLDAMAKLEGSLSTRRKGPFPDYLSEIGQFAKTGARLDILVDCLDYGSFFAPEVHGRVHRAIYEASRDRTAIVRILVCGKAPEPLTEPSGQGFESDSKAEALLKHYGSTLSNDKSFKDWIASLGRPDDEVLRSFAASWLKPLGLVLTPDVIEGIVGICSGNRQLQESDHRSGLFRTLLQFRQFWFALDLKKFGVDIRAQAKREPMFFWIKYAHEAPTSREIGDDALFTFANAYRGPGQLGYSTHDPDLLTTFRTIFEEKWNERDSTEPRLAPEPWVAFLEDFVALRSRRAATGQTQGI